MEPGDNWELLTVVYHQDELHLITGLLSMAGIPAKIDHEAIGDLYGLSVGPLAQVKLLVPGERLEEAQKIIAGDMVDPLDPDTEES